MKDVNVGDIILINQYRDGDNVIVKHSFVVINNQNGEIQGLNYDFICNVMSSFRNESHEADKIKYDGNFPIMYEESNVINSNCKDGYIKADQFYFF